MGHCVRMVPSLPRQIKDNCTRTCGVTVCCESARSAWSELHGNRRSRHGSRAVALLPQGNGVNRLLVVVPLVLIPVLAFGQETREATIAAEQQEKAARLAPPRINKAEQLLLTVRQSLIEQPNGFYPYFGSVYSGGGFTLGAGYRQFTGDRTHWNIAGLYSIEGYKLIEASVVSPGHASGRIDLRASTGWRDATRVEYHGLGIDSPADDSTAFRMQQAYAGGALTARPQRWVLLTAGAAYEDYTIKDPTGNLIPVEGTFSPESAPGVGTNPSYLHSAVGAAIDWRPAADYARRGGLVQHRPSPILRSRGHLQLQPVRRRRRAAHSDSA